MKTFEFTVTDELGIHARPAGMLVKEVKKYSSEVTVEKGGKTASAAKLIALMNLTVKCGDTLLFKIEGPDEDIAAESLKEYLKSHL